MTSELARVVESELKLMRRENGFEEFAVVEGERLLGTRDDDEHVNICEVCEFSGVDAAYVERVELLLLSLHQALEHLVDLGVVATRERAHDDSEDLGLVSSSHH